MTSDEELNSGKYDDLFKRMGKPIVLASEQRHGVTKMEPALTAEEWEKLQTEIVAIDAKHDALIVGYEGAPVIAWPAGKERHALAALALYGQPFGLTRQDVQDERMAAEQYEQSAERYRKEGGPATMTFEAHSALAARHRNRADRIEALLPPTDG